MGTGTDRRDQAWVKEEKTGSAGHWLNCSNTARWHKERAAGDGELCALSLCVTHLEPTKGSGLGKPAAC